MWKILLNQCPKIKMYLSWICIPTSSFGEHIVYLDQSNYSDLYLALKSLPIIKYKSKISSCQFKQNKEKLPLWATELLENHHWLSDLFKASLWIITNLQLKMRLRKRLVSKVLTMNYHWWTRLDRMNIPSFLQNIQLILMVMF